MRKKAIKIELTPEQQEQIRQATGLEAASLEMTAEPLEERVAPIHFVSGVSKASPKLF